MHTASMKKSQGLSKRRENANASAQNEIFMNWLIFGIFMKDWKRQQNVKANVTAQLQSPPLLKLMHLYNNKRSFILNETISGKCKHFKNLEHHLFKRKQSCEKLNVCDFNEG